MASQAHASDDPTDSPAVPASEPPASELHPSGEPETSQGLQPEPSTEDPNQHIEVDVGQSLVSPFVPAASPC